MKLKFLGNHMVIQKIIWIIEKDFQIYFKQSEYKKAFEILYSSINSSKVQFKK
jgi:hypothetical protein